MKDAVNVLNERITELESELRDCEIERGEYDSTRRMVAEMERKNKQLLKRGMTNCAGEHAALVRQQEAITSLKKSRNRLQIEFEDHKRGYSNCLEEQALLSECHRQLQTENERNRQRIAELEAQLDEAIKRGQKQRAEIERLQVLCAEIGLRAVSMHPFIIGEQVNAFIEEFPEYKDWFNEYGSVK